MPRSNLEPLEFLNVVGRMGTATRGESERETFISAGIYLILERGVLHARNSATADVISPIGTSGREGPCPENVLDISTQATR